MPSEAEVVRSYLPASPWGMHLPRSSTGNTFKDFVMEALSTAPMGVAEGRMGGAYSAPNIVGGLPRGATREATKPYQVQGIQQIAGGAKPDPVLTEQPLTDDRINYLMKWLRGNQLPSPETVKSNVTSFMEDADIPFRTRQSKSSDSTYIDYRSPYEKPEVMRQLGIPTPVVRIPGDQHIGTFPKRNEIGNYIDTGISQSENWKQKPNSRTPYESQAVANKGDIPYGTNMDALLEGLKWRTSTSPAYDPNWLVSPEHAPKGVGEQPNVQNTIDPSKPGYSEVINRTGPYQSPDPKQLKLLQSAGLTPFILSLLGSQDSSQPNGQ